MVELGKVPKDTVMSSHIQEKTEEYSKFKVEPLVKDDVDEDDSEEKKDDVV